tara:strand:+ start:101 stop:1084 length:984 start_codon:yes stop_codon:yes gene_type:complete
MKIFNKFSVSELLDLVKNIPEKILYLSIIPAIILLFYFSILAAPKYSSEMAIALSSSSSGGLFGNQSSLLPAAGLTGDTSVNKLKIFLQSIESTSRIASILPLRDIYKKGDLISGYKFKNSIESLHKFRLSNLDISYESDSNSLVIRSKAFNPRDALNINLALIVATNHYLNRNTKLANEIIEANKVCELQSLQSNLTIDNLEASNAKEIISENELISLSDLILQLTENRKTSCSNLSMGMPQDNQLPNITSDLIFSAYEEALKSIASSRLDQWNNKETLEIISEPNLPSKPDSRYGLFKAFAFLIFSILVIYSFSIIRRIFREFEL